MLNSAETASLLVGLSSELRRGLVDTMGTHQGIGQMGAVIRIALALGIALSAVVMVLVGRWGYRNANELAPTAYSREGRVRKARALRRGAVTCQIMGVVLLLPVYLLFAG